MLRGAKRCLIATGVNFRDMPSMGPIVSVMNLHGQQNLL